MVTLQIENTNWKIFLILSKIFWLLSTGTKEDWLTFKDIS